VEGAEGKVLVWEPTGNRRQGTTRKKEEEIRMHECSQGEERRGGECAVELRAWMQTRARHKSSRERQTTRDAHRTKTEEGDERAIRELIRTWKGEEGPRGRGERESPEV